MFISIIYVEFLFKLNVNKCFDFILLTNLKYICIYAKLYKQNNDYLFENKKTNWIWLILKLLKPVHINYYIHDFYLQANKYVLKKPTTNNFTI